VYIDSSFPRRPGDIAILRSERLDPATGECLHFWCNMYGDTMGTLRVWVQPQGSNNDSPVLVWEQSGDHGSPWIQAQVPIPNQPTSFTVNTTIVL
jgi:hypothetical protein